MSDHADHQPRLVFNCDAASQDMVTEMDEHERRRLAGSSNIDPERTGLNRVLLGDPEGPKAALKAFVEKGVCPPSRRARRPYLRIVLGASNTYFRPEDPLAIGTWDDARLEAWVDLAMAALKAEFGDDLVHVSLHLDEDTPHIHALVAPTYLKKPRRVDRKRPGETDEAFAQRQEKAAADPGVPTIGRASHPVFRLKGAFATLRAAFGRHFAALGIHPGVARRDGAPKPKTTRQWVNAEADRLRQRGARMAVKDARLAERNAEITRMEAHLRVPQAELDGAFDEIADLKEAAVRDAYVMVEAREAQLRETFRKQVDELCANVKRWIEPLKALREEAVAETGLLRRVKEALEAAPLKQIKEVRASLHRAETQGYDPGRLGKLQRDQDVERLKPYRAALAKKIADLETEEQPKKGQGSGVEVNLLGEELGGPL